MMRHHGMKLTQAIGELAKLINMDDQRVTQLVRRYDAWYKAIPKNPQPGDPKWNVGVVLCDDVVDMIDTINKENTMNDEQTACSVDTSDTTTTNEEDTTMNCKLVIQHIGVVEDGSGLGLTEDGVEHISSCASCHTIWSAINASQVSDAVPNIESTMELIKNIGEIRMDHTRREKLAELLGTGFGIALEGGDAGVRAAARGTVVVAKHTKEFWDTKGKAATRKGAVATGKGLKVTAVTTGKVAKEVGVTVKIVGGNTITTTIDTIKYRRAARKARKINKSS